MPVTHEIRGAIIQLEAMMRGFIVGRNQDMLYFVAPAENAGQALDS